MSGIGVWSRGWWCGKHFGLGVCVIGVPDDEGACGRELDQIWL